MRHNNQLLSLGIAVAGIVSIGDIVRAQGAFTPATSPFNFPPPAAIDSVLRNEKITHSKTYP
jgi:hypothetical protein